MSDMDQDSREALREARKQVQNAATLLTLAADHCERAAKEGRPEGAVPHLADAYGALRDALLSVCPQPTVGPHSVRLADEEMSAEVLHDIVGGSAAATVSAALARVVEVGELRVTEFLRCGEDAVETQRVLAAGLLALLAERKAVTPDLLWQAFEGCAASRGRPAYDVTGTPV